MTPLSPPQSGVLAGAAMGSRQLFIIGTMLFLNVIDGFDVLAMSFTAPDISRTLHLSPSILGLLFAAGFIGMTIGSFFLAPRADRFGRKPVILVSLSLMTTGMLLCTTGQSAAALCIYRLITGLGVGAMLPVINSLVAEFSSDKRRNISISLTQVGFALGGLAGGLIAVPLLTHFGWQSVFACGAAVSLATLLIVALRIPESPDFLGQRRSSDALTRLNDALRRVGKPALQALPPLRQAMAVSPVRALFAPGWRRATIVLAASYMFTMASYFSFINWLPKLLVQAGLSISAAVTMVAYVNAGAIAGGLLFGGFTQLVGTKRLTITALIAASCVLVLLGATSFVEKAMLMPAIAFGLAIGMALVGLFALLPSVFPASIRATASGFVVGMGRLGSMSGPLLCGILLGVGVTGGLLYLLMALLMIAAGAILILLAGIPSRTDTSQLARRLPHLHRGQICCPSDVPQG